MALVIILQHVACEAPGRILEALVRADISVDTISSGAGQPVPREVGAASGLVIMGGPMSVYETDAYPYLRDELALIESALTRDVPLLGVCLGSQLLAAALGARVYASGYKELGWDSVRLKPAAREDRLFRALPEQFDALHWHGDVFDLPHGARSLAASKLTEHQAFAYGVKAYGLLFHLEVSTPQLELMTAAFPEELAQAGVVAAALLQESVQRLPALQPTATGFFDGFAALISARA